MKHLMGGALTLLSLWSLLSLDVQSAWLVIPAILAVTFALLRPDVVSLLPPFTWRVATPLLILLIGADFLLNVPSFIPPLVRMVVLLLLYRNLAPRRLREDLQLILLCLFCLIMSGVMTVSLLFAFQILLFTPMAMALLFVICLLDRGEQTKQYVIYWVGFGWWRTFRRVWRVLDWRVLSLGSVMFGFVVFVSTLLFVLTPRFNLEQAIPFLQMETQALTGFSEEVSLGEVTDLQKDDSVAIRIDLPSMDELDVETYWRMMVLDRYFDGRFTLSDSLRSTAFRQQLNVRELEMNRLVATAGQGDLWTFYMEGGISRYLPVPGDFGVLRFQSKQAMEVLREPRVYAIDSVSQSVFSYQIEGLVFNATYPAGPRETRILAVAKRGDEFSESRYPLTTLELDVSPEDLARLAEVNRSIHGAEQSSVPDYSQKTKQWLWDNYEYSLQPNGTSGDYEDPVVNWLSGGNRGHCELFASALVLLAREAGYPARLVIGFAGGSWNSVEDYFVLRNSDAHAWVEVYDKTSNEWLRIDPTPGYGSINPGADVSESMQFDTGWGAWIDSLRIQWYRRIVNFEQQDQIELAMSAKDMVKAFTDEFSARAKAILFEFKTWLYQPFSAGNLVRGLVVIFFVLSLYFLWLSRYRFMGLFFRVLRRPKALDPVRRQASRYMKRLDEKHGEAVPHRLKLELQTLRFGPEVKSGTAKTIFSRAKKAMRQKRTL